MEFGLVVVQSDNVGVQKPINDETLRATARSLLVSVNEASVAARNGWLFFLALLAYLFIAAASVSHKDLLLNTPVTLPFLGIPLRLDSFFLFGPLVLLFVHFGLLVQHVLLSRKIIELDGILTEDESWRGRRMHPLRLEMHSYFYTQALAGANRSKVFATFLHGMVWLSLVLLPVFLILYFQITFLPYHEEKITWAHRIYLIIELVILVGVGIFLRKPNANFWQALWRSGVQHSTNFFVTAGLVGAALFFSICVVTFPGEWIDRQLSKIPGLSFYANKVLNGGETRVSEARVFAPTGYFFADTGFTGDEFKGLFHRNLIVVDEDLVIEAERSSEDVTYSFRGRNLRFANLSRSDLRYSDFTDAILEDAKLEGTILKQARFGCQELREEATVDATVEDYRARGCAMLGRANFTSADLTGADFRSTYARSVVFNDAILQGAKFDSAILASASFEAAKGADASFISAFLTEGRFTGAQMQGADFSGAVVLGSDFSSAQLTGAILSFAWLQAANFSDAWLNVADLTGGNLWGANLSGAKIGGADFSFAQIWDVKGPGFESADKVFLSGLMLERPSEEEKQKLEKVLTWALTAETTAVLTSMLKQGTIAGWQKGADYRRWRAAKQKFDGNQGDAFQKSYTDLVVRIACQNVRVNMATTTGVIRRVAKENFSGDIERFLTEMQKPECGVFALIGEDLRKELLKEVHTRRRDGS